LVGRLAAPCRQGELRAGFHKAVLEVADARRIVFDRERAAVHDDLAAVREDDADRPDARGDNTPSEEGATFATMLGSTTYAGLV